MNQRDIVAMQKRLGESVACCRWCHEWKPYSKMYRSSTTKDGLGRFLGLVTCNSCYYKIRSAVQDEATIGRLLTWLERNLGVKITVRCNATGLVIYRERREVRGGPKPSPSSSSPSAPGQLPG